MRTRGWWALLLAAVLTLPAQASSAPSVVPNAAVCGGPGFTLLQSPLRRSCVHTTPDGYDGRLQARWAGITPATAPPVCYGDGQSGARVQLIYGYPAGQPDRESVIVPQVRALMAPRMQAVIKASSAGKDLGIRFAFDAPCARLSVPVVRFPASTVASPGADDQFLKIRDELIRLGYTRTDRKYEVIWDWWNNKGICGLGELLYGADQPTPVNEHNGGPVVGSHTDPAGVLGLQDYADRARYAAVWRSPTGPKGYNCFEMGQSHAEVQVHELFHSLGAVQPSAPHSDSGGHCTDTPSVMCPAGRVPAVPSCGQQAVEVLDCGMDDYWNPNPASGSYLSKADNIATSQFFGPQLADRFVGAPV